MAKPAYQAEQIWLRSFLEYQDEVCFEVRAERSMKSYGIDFMDVMFILRHGTIVWADRDACGARITVVGRNCDEEEIEVEGRMVSEMMHVSVVNVRKTLRLGK